jgi:hypothetical protein
VSGTVNHGKTSCSLHPRGWSRAHGHRGRRQDLFTAPAGVFPRIKLVGGAEWCPLLSLIAFQVGVLQALHG